MRGSRDNDDDDSYFGEGPGKGGQAAGDAGTTAAPANGNMDEDDPLDAFMAEINAEVAALPKAKVEAPKAQQKAAWELNDMDDDHVASFCDAFHDQQVKKQEERERLLGKEKAAREAALEDSDEDGDRRRKPIEPLPQIDHSAKTYTEVKFDFYEEHDDIKNLDDIEIMKLRHDFRLSTTGTDVVNPVASFAHLGLPKELMEGIRQHGYKTPMPIQSQGIPCALKGRDIIGIAETGSGKTVAYLLPMLVHCIDQPPLEQNEGPIGLVLCPTRELAIQIEKEVFKFNKLMGLHSVTLVGGLSKQEQFKEVKKGTEIIIGNPGRVIDIVKMKGINLERVTFLVLDEADRMLNMGFEYQVRSIAQNIRPSRQTLLFSATFPPKIERLGRDLLSNPVRITVGHAGQAAECIDQHFVVFKNDEDKWGWLSERAAEIMENGQMLIFVESKTSAEELAQNFVDFLDTKTVFLHGGLDQNERMQIFNDYKKQKVHVMIATDVAARGLDIPTIKTVISWDSAGDIETHTHRIGRTGRAGEKGTAFTFLTHEESKFAAYLVESLESAEFEVSEELLELAMNHGPFRGARLAGQKWEGKKKGGEGSGPKGGATQGLGFDVAKATPKSSRDLERKLNEEADRQMELNRRMMMGVRGGKASGIELKGVGAAKFGGFVSASEQRPAPKPFIPTQDSDSDEDLLAPGVTAAFGRGAGGVPLPKRPLSNRFKAAPAVVPHVASPLAKPPGMVGGDSWGDWGDAQTPKAPGFVAPGIAPAMGGPPEPKVIPHLFETGGKDGWGKDGWGKDGKGKGKDGKDGKGKGKDGWGKDGKGKDGKGKDGKGKDGKGKDDKGKGKGKGKGKDDRNGTGADLDGGDFFGAAMSMPSYGRDFFEAPASNTPATTGGPAVPTGFTGNIQDLKGAAPPGGGQAASGMGSSPLSSMPAPIVPDEDDFEAWCRAQSVMSDVSAAAAAFPPQPPSSPAAFPPQQPSLTATFPPQLPGSAAFPPQPPAQVSESAGRLPVIVPDAKPEPVGPLPSLSELAAGADKIGKTPQKRRDRSKSRDNREVDRGRDRSTGRRKKDSRERSSGRKKKDSRERSSGRKKKRRRSSSDDSRRDRGRRRR